MRIVIQNSDAEKPTVIRVPTRGLITGVGPIAIATSQTEISFRQARKICRALVKGRKALNGEPMVEVSTTDGEHVRIYL